MLDLSYSRSKRLLKRADFTRLFSGSQCFRRSCFSVYRMPQEFGIPRLGITFKLKASSVGRNRIKRLLREFFRVNQHQFGVFDFNFVIYMPREGVFSTGRLRKELEQWLQSLGRSSFSPSTK